MGKGEYIFFTENENPEFVGFLNNIFNECKINNVIYLDFQSTSYTSRKNVSQKIHKREHIWEGKPEIRIFSNFYTQSYSAMELQTSVKQILIWMDES